MGNAKKMTFSCTAKEAQKIKAVAADAGISVSKLLVLGVNFAEKELGAVISARKHLNDNIKTN